jgi:hypothetical protein
VIRRVIGALALVAIGIPVPVATASAQPVTWYDGPCTDNVGITVVIDFRELTGGVNVRCAPGPVTSGLDALDKAGISWEGTRRFPSLVCRIAGKPGVDSEACVNAPPLSAYWGYWLAPRGGEWCFSNLGAGSRKPPPGTVEGWSFALNKTASDTPPPGYAPPPPIDGEPPNPLNGSDCGAATSPPVPATTTPSTPSTTATTVGVPPQTPPPTTAPAAQVVAATTTPKGSSQVASSSATTTSILTTASSMVTTSVSASTTQPATDGSGSLDAAALGIATTSVLEATPTTPLGTVDLGDDGRGDGGFGAATAIGIVVAASLIGAGVWAARRRRAVP